MAKRGRKPKPTNLKLIQGNPGKRKVEETAEPAPEPIPLHMPPPDYLDEAAAAEWKRLAPELQRWGLLTRLDVAAFVVYCEAWARLRQAKAKLDEEGHISVSPKGYPQQSAWLSIYNRAAKTIKDFGSEFGLTPVARVSLRGTAQGDLFDAPPESGEKSGTGGFYEL